MKKLFSVLLILLMMAGVIAVAPVTASAADQSVSITGKTVTALETDIQMALNNGANTTVEVNGTKTDADATLGLDIPAGKTLIWNAVYEGDGSFGSSLICLTGDGDFTMTGGSITQPEDYDALYTTISGTVTISGGTVTATGNNGRAINSANNVTVSGGKVEATGDNGNAICTDSGNVTISGGTVEANKIYSTAIFSYSGSIKVTSGTVKATGTYGVAINSSIAVYLTGTCTGDLYVDSDGAIVEVDTLAVPAARDGTSTGLTVKEGTGTAKWDCTGAKPVIKFTIGTATPQMEWGAYATYAVNVVGGTANKATAAAGDTVTITATVPSGKVFDKWTAMGVTLTEAQKTSTSISFTMPAGAVTVTAGIKDAKGIFGTNAKWTGAWWHYVLFFLGFGFIWMWF